MATTVKVSDFIKASRKYVQEKTAQANPDGNPYLTKDEAKSLPKDLRDNFENHRVGGQANARVSVKKFADKFVKYVAASARAADRAADGLLDSGDARRLPRDLRDNFWNYVRATQAAGKGASLATPKLRDAVSTAMRGVFYVSETDSTPEFIHTSKGADTPISAKGVMESFRGQIASTLEEEVGNLGDYAGEVWTAKDSREFLEDLTTPADPSDDYDRKNAKGFAELKALFDANLRDVRVVKIGPKDEEGGVAMDGGTYAYLVLGKTSDGQLAGVAFQAAET